MTRNPSVSLTSEQQKFVSRLVKSGRYSGVSEIMRAGLRLLERDEAQREAMIRSVEDSVRQGLSSGSAEPMESAAELSKEFKKRRAR